jgi:hypothetical protein
MEDDLEGTQAYFAPRTQDELDEMLKGMGASRPTRTIGATLSPTLIDELGNPVPVDVNGEPIYFEPNKDYDPDAKPSFDNFKNNMSEMAEGVADFVQAPIEGVKEFGRGVAQAGSDFSERVSTGNSTLGDIFGTVGALLGVGPATSIATKGVSSTFDDLADNTTSRIFLTPKTPNLSSEQSANYADALDLVDQGVDPLSIKQQTGWENLANKEWVYEIDDSGAQTRESALLNNATKDVEYTRPGGAVSGQERRGMLLQAQREVIDLKKQLQSGDIDQVMFEDLVAAQQRSLDAELSARTEPTTFIKPMPLAPSLKARGTLDQTFYHPEVSNYVDTAGYTATVGALKGRDNNVLGDHDGYNKVINAYRKDDDVDDKTPGILKRRGTMVHEVQHLVDDASGSAGSGFNDKRSPEIKKAARSRFLAEVNAFKKNKMEDTLDTLNFSFVGAPMDSVGLSDMVRRSLVTDAKDGTSLDEDMFKAEMLEKGYSDPDTTLSYLKETNPAIWNNVKEYGSILGSRNAQLAYMKDFDVYEHELGEVKARLADSRSTLTPEELSNSLATPDIRRSSGKLPVDLSLIFTPDEYR